MALSLRSKTNAGVCNGPDSGRESVIKANGAKPIPGQDADAAATAADGFLAGQICPGACLRDWDKRKTPFARPLLERTYEWRTRPKRRGQDSNLRTSYPVTDLANPRFRPLSHLS